MRQCRFEAGELGRLKLIPACPFDRLQLIVHGMPPLLTSCQPKEQCMPINKPATGAAADQILMPSGPREMAAMPVRDTSTRPNGCISEMN
jgi:hypothetical protein